MHWWSNASRGEKQAYFIGLGVLAFTILIFAYTGF
jgi:hypothetical protein